MEPQPQDLTVAVTVYSRAEFVIEAVQSALNQTVPVKVIVVEDFGPNAQLKDLVVRQFGNRIAYFRNEKNRGLFDNWNACLDCCQTPWISILHDDDVLRPCWAETLLALARTAPNRGVYFGQNGFIEEEKIIPAATPSWKDGWRDIALDEFAEMNTLMFPGQLFRVADARAVGGFRRNSLFCGDWDMWFRLALRGGAAQSATEVALVRTHYGEDRGTSRVERKGWKWALDNVQRKRNLRLLAQERGLRVPFDRRKLLRQQPVPTRYLLRFAAGLSPRLLAYNHWLYVHSKAPSAGHTALQIFLKLTGPRGARRLSRIWNWRHRPRPKV